VSRAPLPSEKQSPSAGTPVDAPGGLRLHRWSDRAVVVVAVMALAAGFGQFGVVAALGDVSTQLGHVAAGSSIADKVGLSATSLGIGLAVIRLASLGSLPVIGVADRIGRRRVILAVTTAGLALTVVAAASPGYWWFVVIFALGRPLLSSTNALADVMAAEETDARDRTKAVALIAAGYGVGAGLSAIVHSLASGTLGFRGIFALAVVPLGVVILLRRWVEEPSRFMVARASKEHPTPVLGAIGSRFRGRVVVVCLITFAISVVSGPASSFVFLYAQDVLHQAGYITALMVVAAGIVGLFGLLAGRWLSDHLGRRPTGAVAVIAVAATATLAYTGSSAALVTGYVLGVLAGSLLAPALGALLTELFPTGVRASATGWSVTAGVLGAVAGLIVFGAVADVGNRFAAAAELTFLPVACAAVLFWFIPETKGREPESLWPGEGEEPTPPVAPRSS
jgi:MFS family permease